MKPSASRRRFLKQAALSAALLGAAERSKAASPAQTPPNILFICVDDLRPELGCYGRQEIHSPHLDAQARRSRLFQNHFTQVPTCGASRCCLLTGYRPETPAKIGNGAFESLGRSPDTAPMSLPRFFKDHGYRTVSVGKVSHMPDGRRRAKPSGRFDDQGEMIGSGVDDGEPELACAWDKVYTPTAEWQDPWSAFFAYAGGKTRSYTEEKSSAVEAIDAPDTAYPDGRIAEAAIQELTELRQTGKPFFLAAGFYKPHLPFCAPKQYWDRYERDALSLPKHPDPPEGVDLKLSLHRNDELTGRYSTLGDPAEATEAETRLLRHGYFACVSYVDAQIGKVLNALDDLGLRENTIVVVWGDHGWHLGDLHVWGKHTTFEFSLRSTLMIETPGMRKPGQITSGLIETVDLYPTLAALCGLTPPDTLHGSDCSPMLRDPAAPGKEAAYSYWKRGKHIACSLRTDRYRLTRWRDSRGPIQQTELYDHQNDPEESANIAAAHPEVVKELLPLWEKGWHFKHSG